MLRALLSHSVEVVARDKAAAATVTAISAHLRTAGLGGQGLSLPTGATCVVTPASLSSSPFLTRRALISTGSKASRAVAGIVPDEVTPVQALTKTTAAPLASPPSKPARRLWAPSSNTPSAPNRASTGMEDFDLDLDDDPPKKPASKPSHAPPAVTPKVAGSAFRAFDVPKPSPKVAGPAVAPKLPPPPAKIPEVQPRRRPVASQEDSSSARSDDESDEDFEAPKSRGASKKKRAARAPRRSKAAPNKRARSRAPSIPRGSPAPVTPVRRTVVAGSDSESDRNLGEWMVFFYFWP